MSGRFPDADNIESLWSLLEQGLDVHRRVPPDRFDVDAHYDPTGKRKNTSHTPYGCFINEPGLFDARFFNMSPREAYQTDPMGRLALVTAYEALEMSVPSMVNLVMTGGKSMQQKTSTHIISREIYALLALDVSIIISSSKGQATMSIQLVPRAFPRYN